MHCVRISKDGLVYVCDRTNDRFQIFRKDGTFVSEHFFERNTRLNGSVYEIAFSPDKEQKFIYMVDGSNGEVRIVERATNEMLGRFGRVGRQAGEFVAAHNIAVDHRGQHLHRRGGDRSAGAAVPPARSAELNARHRGEPPWIEICVES